MISDTIPDTIPDTPDTTLSAAALDPRAPSEGMAQAIERAEQIAAFDAILQRFEHNTLTERDKGTAFELLVREVLSRAQPWCDQFAQVQTYAEWAKEHQELSHGDARDTGVDLVATIRRDFQNLVPPPPS